MSNDMDVMGAWIRYGDVWSDWRKTRSNDGIGEEETLELKSNEDIVAISGYSWDEYGSTSSLQAETSAGRNWGPHGLHIPDDSTSLRSSPSNGLRLNHISGSESVGKIILRYQMKTLMIVSICIVFYMFGDCWQILLLWIAFIISPAFKSSNY